MVGRAGPDDAPDGDGEQGSQGHVRADEGHGEDGDHDVEGRRGGLGQRGEDDDEGAGEGCEHKGGEAERPDASASLSVGQAAPPAACLFPSRCRASLSCAMAPSFTAGNPCPGALPLP